MNSESLKAKRIVIASRFRTTVPVMNLCDFVKDRSIECILILHPFSFNTAVGSRYKHYRQGVMVDNKTIMYSRQSHELLLYLKTLWQTWQWLFKKKADIFIGLGVLDAFSGIVLKKIGRVDQVIFYSLDFSPRRFRGRGLNTIYNWLERWVVIQTDFVWNLSPLMVSAREQFRGVPPSYRAKQIIVPIGVDTGAVHYGIDGIERYQLCYAGHLRAGQGVDFLLRLLPRIIERVPETTLLLIGGGDKEESLRTFAQELGIAEQVRFTGFMENQKEMEECIARSVIALAPYVDDPLNLTRYTDPGKPKAYLAAGVPVIMTDIVAIAGIIETRRCGFSVPYQETAFVEKIVQLLMDEQLLREYKDNARCLAEEFDWERIFKQGFMAAGFY